MDRGRLATWVIAAGGVLGLVLLITVDSIDKVLDARFWMAPLALVVAGLVIQIHHSIRESRKSPAEVREEFFRRHQAPEKNPTN